VLGYEITTRINLSNLLFYICILITLFKMPVRINAPITMTSALFTLLVISILNNGTTGFSPCTKCTSCTKQINYESSSAFKGLSQQTAVRSSSALSLGSNANEINPITAGCTVALVTPFTPTGEIDFPSLRRLLHLHIESKTDGLCILGTTAEASLLSMSERQSILDVVVAEAKGKIPLLIGTGAINPSDVRAMTLQAIDSGCDAALVVTPPYIKPPTRGLVRHFTDVAELGLPTVIYNVPSRTCVDLSPTTIAQIAQENHNIVGCKEATGDTSRVASIRSAESSERPPLLLYSGDDSSQKEFVLSGGDGCISVSANVAPDMMRRMIDAARRGDEEEAGRLDGLLQGLHRDIFCEANPIPAKWALKRMGLVESAFCRPPLCELEEEYIGVMEDALGKAGLL